MEKEFEWRTGRKCVFKIFVHLIFTTKYRRHVINKEMLSCARNFGLTSKTNYGAFIFGVQATVPYHAVELP